MGFCNARCILMYFLVLQLLLGVLVAASVVSSKVPYFYWDSSYFREHILGATTLRAWGLGNAIGAFILSILGIVFSWVSSPAFIITFCVLQTLLSLDHGALTVLVYISVFKTLDKHGGSLIPDSMLSSSTEQRVQMSNDVLAAVLTPSTALTVFGLLTLIPTIFTAKQLVYHSRNKYNDGDADQGVSLTI